MMVYYTAFRKMRQEASCRKRRPLLGIFTIFSEEKRFPFIVPCDICRFFGGILTFFSQSRAKSPHPPASPVSARPPRADPKEPSDGGSARIPLTNSGNIIHRKAKFLHNYIRCLLTKTRKNAEGARRRPSRRANAAKRAPGWPAVPVRRRFRGRGRETRRGRLQSVPAV